MYHITISPRAKKELKNIAKLYRKAIRNAIDELKETPFIGKPLSRELTGKYSYRIGVYRIIYTVNKPDKKINILTAGHRGTIYN